MKPKPIDVRIRPALLLLGVQARQLREATGLTGCTVSGILNGTRPLRPTEWRPVERLLRRRLREMLTK